MGWRTWLGGLAVAVASALAIGLAVERPGPSSGVKETEDALVLRVRIRSWDIEVEDPVGWRDRTLYVPIGRPVRLDVESDVPGAGLLLPELGRRVRAPGQLAIRLESEEPMPVFATGLGRPVQTELVPLTAEAWDDPCRFVTCCGMTCADSDPLAAGERIFVRNGCPQCHALEAGELGPSLHGISGSERELESGERVVADAAYLEAAIADPQRHIARGYTRVAMPAFRLSTCELDALRAYLTSLR